MSALQQTEQEVLDEYSRLAGNLDKVGPAGVWQSRHRLTSNWRYQLADITTELSQLQPEILAQLRPLETRLGLVLTLFKASVWQYLSQEQAREEEEEMQQKQQQFR